jgi:hypothetical protein
VSLVLRALVVRLVDERPSAAPPGVMGLSMPLRKAAVVAIELKKGVCCGYNQFIVVLVKVGCYSIL